MPLLAIPILLAISCAEHPLSLRGLAGTEVTLLVAEHPQDDGVILERLEDDRWTEIREVSGEDRWILTWPGEGETFRLAETDSGPYGEPLTVESLEISLFSADAGSHRIPGDSVEATISMQGPVEGVVESVVLRFRRQNDGKTRWWQPDCEGEDCWSDTPVVYATLSTLDSMTEITPACLVAEGPSGIEHLIAEIVIPGEQDKEVLLDQVWTSWATWDDQWLWGDLHAHSNLSMDGCEDVDQNCSERGSTPAEDFFDQARSHALDFAALTDHAEYVTYRPDGAGTEPMYHVWEE